MAAPPAAAMPEPLPAPPAAPLPAAPLATSPAKAAAAKLATEVSSELVKARAMLLSVPELQGLVAAEALGSESSSGMARPAYTPAAGQQHLQPSGAKGVHCNINVWWLDWFTSPTITSGVSRSKVQDLIDYYFKKPGPWPTRFKLEVQVPSNKLPHESIGSLKVISPIEMVRA